MKLKKLMSSFLTILFCLNGTVSASTDLGQFENTSVIAKKMRSFSTYSELVTHLKKTSATDGLKFEQYVQANGLMKQRLPSFSVTKNVMTFPTMAKLELRINKEYDVIISWKGTEKKLTTGMTFEERLQAIESMNPAKTTSVFDLLIPDARADFGLTIGIGAAALLLGLAYGAYQAHQDAVAQDRAEEQDRIRRQVVITRSREMLAACRNSASLALEELAANFNSVSDQLTTTCRNIPETCQTIRATLDCIRVKINQANLSHNGNRDSRKEVVIDVATGRARVTGSAQ